MTAWHFLLAQMCELAFGWWKVCANLVYEKNEDFHFHTNDQASCCCRLPYIQFIKIVNLFGSERYFSLFFRAIVLVEARKMKWSLRRIYNKRFFRKSLKFFFFLFSSSFPSFLCLLKHISLVHKALRGNNVRIVPKKKSVFDYSLIGLGGFFKLMLDVERGNEWNGSLLS